MQLAGTIAVPAGMFQGVSPIPEAEISMAGATASNHRCSGFFALSDLVNAACKSSPRLLPITS